MDKTEPELWLDRALEDGNWAFQSMLYDKLNRDDEFDEQKEKLEKDRPKHRRRNIRRLASRWSMKRPVIIKDR